ncbi:MAG: sulfate reduction electron transfer complex DsrMKJOP subunit DsrO [Planctomycetota bacterium]|jgi:molybdopterin-containing oxidoreductase family iron-sulfur binding subunit
MKKLNRRQLIKLAAITGAGALLPRQVQAISSFGSSKLEEFLKKLTGTGRYTSQPEWVSPPDPKNKFGMVIDLGLCIGCRRCAYACKLENNIPDVISPPYIVVFEYDQTGYKEFAPMAEKFEHVNRMSYTKLRKDKVYMPVQCNHCDRAPCATVCPTGASYKASDGIVMVDWTKCIGCKYCIQACPYNARRFNWLTPEVPPDRINPAVPMRPHGVVEKCTFCVHRTRKGMTTRCVEACPNKARIFGNLNDPDSEISKIVSTKQTFTIKERLNTGPNIYYPTEVKRKPMRWFKPLPPPRNIRGTKL